MEAFETIVACAMSPSNRRGDRRRAVGFVDRQGGTSSVVEDDGPSAVAPIMTSGGGKRRKGCSCANCHEALDKDATKTAEADAVARQAMSKDPLMHLCRPCTDFSEAKHITPHQLVAAKKNHKEAAQLDEERREFLHNRSKPTDRNFQPEEVFYDEVSGSRLSQRFGFKSRHKFKEDSGYFLDG